MTALVSAFLTKSIYLLRINTLILVALLVAALPGMANPPKTIDEIVAVVNNDVVLQSELDHYINRIVHKLKAKQTAIPARDILEKQALERLILLRIQIQLAKRRGVKVNDETVNQALINLAKKNKMTLHEFRNQIKSQGIDFKDLRDSIRKEIMLARLRSYSIRNKVRVSKEEIDQFLASQTQMAFRHNQFKLQHILVSVPDDADPRVIKRKLQKMQLIKKRLDKGFDFSTAAVTWSDGQKALEGGMLGWFKTGQVPRVFVKHVVRMKPGQISNIIRSPSGFHIVKVIDAKGGAQKQIITQYNARHILIRTSDLITDKDAKRRLLGIRERVQNGANFSDLAKAHSDDISSARKGGELGWIGPGDTVPPFEAALKTTGKNQISPPFKSRFGWHIVQVLDVRKHDNTKVFQRNIAKRLLMARKQREHLQIWLRRLRDESYVEYRNPKHKGS